MGLKTIHLVSLDATDAAVIAECQRRAWPTERQISNQNLLFRLLLDVLATMILGFIFLVNANDSSFASVLVVFVLLIQAQLSDLYFRKRRELALTQQLVRKLIDREVAATGKDAP